MIVGLTVLALGQTMAAGAICGAPFTPSQAKLQKFKDYATASSGGFTDRATVYWLTFQQGADFIPDEEIVIMIQVRPGTVISGHRVNNLPVKFGTEAFRAQHYPKRNQPASVGLGVIGVHSRTPNPARGLKEFQMWHELIDAQIQFGQAQKGYITGTIDLRLPTKDRTWLQGKFKAKLDGF
jgi:hypothetical protein